MNRSISTKTHGMIDYSWASTAAAMPKMMTNAPAASRLIQNAGLVAGANTMLTNYEAGVLKLMPMKAHLAFDALLGGLLLLAPLLVPASERRYALIPMAFGAVSLFSALMTESTSTTERATFTPPLPTARAKA